MQTSFEKGYCISTLLAFSSGAVVVTAGETWRQFCCWTVNNKGFQMDRLGGQANLAFDLLSKFHSESCFSGICWSQRETWAAGFHRFRLCTVPIYMQKHVWGNLYYQNGRSVLPNPLVIKKTRFDCSVNHRSWVDHSCKCAVRRSSKSPWDAEYTTDMAVPLKFEQDDQAAITVTRSGYSAKLRHLGRVHKVIFQSVNEQLENNTFNLEYCETSMHLATGFTKIISNGVEWQTTLQQLCIQPVS